MALCLADDPPCWPMSYIISARFAAAQAPSRIRATRVHLMKSFNLLLCFHSPDGDELDFDSKCIERENMCAPDCFEPDTCPNGAHNETCAVLWPSKIKVGVLAQTNFVP